MEIVFQERRIEKSILWKILSAVDNFLSRKLSILFSQSVRDFGRKSKWYDDELNVRFYLLERGVAKALLIFRGKR